MPFAIPNLMPQPMPPVSIAAPLHAVSPLQQAVQDMPGLDGGWSIHMMPTAAYHNFIVSNNIHAPYSTGHSLMAFSDLSTRVTYLPEAALQLSSNDLQRVLAHEYGHLTLNTHDEAKANKWMDQWMNKKSKK